MNPFLNDYYSRLRAWHQLKESLTQADTHTVCIEVDKFWQQCPMSNHYLHPADMEDWPSPWRLISDNTYCKYGRALGMIYTLLLLGINNIDLVDGTDYNEEHAVIILVENGKYTLNWYPNSVLNTDLAEFTNTSKIDITTLIKKIGNE